MDMRQLSRMFQESGEQDNWTYGESVGVLHERLRVICLIQQVIHDMEEGKDPSDGVRCLLEKVIHRLAPTGSSLSCHDATS